MKARVRRKIFDNRYNPRMRYSRQQLFRSMIGILDWWRTDDGYEYRFNHCCGKITKTKIL